MERFDLIVIGGGPAGYLAAERAGEQSLKTLLVEKREVGGVCLNEGCIPTKTLLHAAKLLEYAGKKSQSYGVRCTGVQFDHAAAVRKKNEVVAALVGGVKSTLRKKNVQVVYAQASIARQNGIFEVQAGDAAYASPNVLIASGSNPVLPPIPGLSDALDRGAAMTSREMLDAAEAPGRLCVVGGGVIGLEMASYFQSAGSRVTVIEMMEGIGGEIDPDASAVLRGTLEEKGVAFHLGSRVTEILNNTVAFEKTGEKHQLSYDRLLVSTGRKPALDIPGLQATGVLIKDGAIVTDGQCKTNVPGLYAAGDVNGKYMLAHVAYREAEAAVNNILGKPDAVDYSAVPGVIYTQPEVAFAGITAKQASGRGIAAAEKKVSINFSGRHIAESGISNGFAKLVIDDKKGILLGAVLVSAYASEIIYSLSLMIQNKIPVESIQRTMFPHPAVSEIIKEALYS